MECDAVKGCRLKTLFSQGVVGMIKWTDLGGHMYTGMFKGADTGFIRMSTAAPVGNGNMIPGIAIKLLRDL